jgi:SNF2 family DNA or RNA helicase
LSSTRELRILDDELFTHIDSLPREEQRDYLFLIPHPQFAGRWKVDGLDSSFFLDFEEQIGKYRTVSPASLDEFLERADNLLYKVVFTDDPLEILSAWEHLNDRPPFVLNSNMGDFLREKGLEREAAVVDECGFLPFQLQGFNKLRQDDLKAGLAIWSTGTGKTALEAALIKQHMEVEDYEFGLVVCKRNNKQDTLRKLRELGGIDYAFVYDGTPKQREEMMDLASFLLAENDRIVMITNYEKLRDDTEAFIDLVEDRKVVVFWDEMPTKLSNRSTMLYDAVRTVFYDSDGRQVKWSTRRPAKLRQYDFTATPIENDPVGLLNQVRLLDPEVWPTIKGWEKKYVAGRDFFSKLPNKFDNLDLMGLEIDFMTHQVDKEDPDIAKLFPKVRDEIIYVDWSPEDRRVYTLLQEIAVEMAKKAREAKDDPEAEAVKPFNPLQLIGVLQMLCVAPSMVQKSAENREEFEAVLAEAADDEEYAYLEQFASGSEAAAELLRRLKKPLNDDKSEKLEKLRDLIQEKHPNQKINVFSAYADYIFPAIEAKFKEWGVSYVVYRGTEKQRQEAKDRFRTDPEIQVFFSSDAGSDSIDLPEASVHIDLDLPYTWARLIQRRNRLHRVNSEHEYVTCYMLMMPDSVEDRRREIIEKKQGYHRGVFKGEISEDAISARMTAEDMWYILTGATLDDMLVG